jgi:hypothetical protein
MYHNDDLLKWLSEHGLNIPNLVLDGCVHRFIPDGSTEEDGYYVGSRNTLNGVDYPTLTVKDFRKDEKLFYDGRKKSGKVFTIEENVVFEKIRAEEALKKKHLEKSGLVIVRTERFILFKSQSLQLGIRT